ncbi:hypothetical protein F2Q70_00003524 [Brassica cretica]|uniref:Uncharacterized protein n=1 Tax=Brassica cretica TaxID=69181 RepID=A0A8S9IZI8_BRACR|nr:hypothetical protein F2Q70_00003524 [Brassica cretica]
MIEREKEEETFQENLPMRMNSSLRKALRRKRESSDKSSKRIVTQRPNTCSARSLRSDRARVETRTLKLDLYVASELERSLGRYVATELELELGRYIATELEPKFGRYRWNKAQDKTIEKLKDKCKALSKTVKKQAKTSAKFMKKVADVLTRGGIAGCSSADFAFANTSPFTACFDDRERG